MDLLDYRDLLAGLGLSERTIRTYTAAVRRLHRHCRQQRLDPTVLTPAQVRAWADTLPMSWSSRKLARSALRHYYDGRADRPWRAVRVPRRPPRRWRGLEPEDAHVLREAALMVGGRPGLAVLIGLYTAARVSEIAAMRWDGVDFAAGTIRWWRTKVDDWHTVPLHPVLAEALAAARTEHHVCIFAGDGGRPHVTTQAVWGWVRQVGDRAGVPVTPHQLRATAITMALDATGDLDAAAAFAGHGDVRVTRGYTRTSTRRLDAAIAALDY